ncbi:MarR family winged helix-turn-helix transcriptional regulator [Amycolatopsis sp. NBC_01480]|uniref:MarR family winged helix-turn-helix transcriptional regulator n=1 Tax=Amycolatopsis sp. NBC_01480 TaxID=2903562 RepID=UPI002E2A6832|nr:MarR family transcriptional regulator [Amycolatopsis sp. NBC_01480]
MTYSSAVEFGLNLKQAQHLLGLRIDDALRPLGLSLGLWRVLREIGRTPGASASELGRTSFHTPQTVGGLLQRLQDQQLVERSSARGRIVENHLTRQGKKVLGQATAAVDEVIGGSLAHLDAAHIEQAGRFLTEYIAALTSPQRDS